MSVRQSFFNECVINRRMFGQEKSFAGSERGFIAQGVFAGSVRKIGADATEIAGTGAE